MITSFVVRRLVKNNMTGAFVPARAGKGLQCGGINMWHFRHALLCASDAALLMKVNHTDQVLTNRGRPRSRSHAREFFSTDMTAKAVHNIG